MKRINIIIVILFLVFCLAHQGLAQAKVKPKVKIDNPVFIFESVPEGAHVLHEFVIKNTGDTPLHINNVLPP
ncbi:MAG: DUF1573 domain-containing protein [Desulfobacula sp.]|nr:DUF1573 domain-containing protein [Desulfobacula sp.]